MRRHAITNEKREARLALVFILPWVIGFFAFTLIPIIMSFYYSLCDYNVIADPEFVGLDNYISVFTDEVSVISIQNTAYMLLFGTILVTVISMLVALLLNNKKLRGTAGFRIVFFIPTLIPLVVASLLWVWILQYENGVINTILRSIGISNPPAWLGSPFWAKPALILMMVWACGNSVIIYLAGLQDISETLYESAELDGAGFARKTISITIPLLKPIILYNVVTLVINIFQQFAEAQIMTEGGPDRATEFFALYIYQNAFQYFKMGYACAQSWVMLIIALIIVFVLFRLLGMGDDSGAKPKRKKRRG